MYFLLDSPDNTNNNNPDRYSKNLDFFSLFLAGPQRTTTSAFDASSSTFAKYADTSNSNQQQRESLNETLINFALKFITEIYQILVCGWSDLLVRIYECLHSSTSWLPASAHRFLLPDSVLREFSTSTFEFRIFLVLVNLLFVLVTSVFILWCLLRTKINFYYQQQQHKGS